MSIIVIIICIVILLGITDCNIETYRNQEGGPGLIDYMEVPNFNKNITPPMMLYAYHDKYYYPDKYYYRYNPYNYY